VSIKDVYEEFRAPRYKFRGGNRRYLNFLDQETGVYISVLVDEPQLNPDLANRNVEKILADGRNDIEITSVPFVDEIRFIVGITIGGRLPRRIGSHALVMYIDNPNSPTRDLDNIWRNDIMLDASGHFGIGWRIRSSASDIVVPERFPSPITIDSYRRYFFPRNNEMWYTYSYSIDREAGVHIHSLISEMYERTSFQCAIKTSTLLQQSGLFHGIRRSLFPGDIKRFLDRYIPIYKNIMRLIDKSSYDLGISPLLQQSLI